MSETELLEALSVLSGKWMARQSAVSALWERVRTAVAGGDHARAQQALEEVLQITPRDDDAWHWLATEFLEQQSFDAAYDAVLRAVTLEPLAVGHHALFGRIRSQCHSPARDHAYAEAARFAESLPESSLPSGTDLAQIISGLAERTDTLEWHGWLYLGLMYSAVGDLPAATKAFENAIAKFPDDALLWRNRADLLAELGRTEESTWARAYHFYYSAKYPEAIDHFKLLLGTSLADAACHIALAKCYWRTRRFAEGIELCEAAIARFGEVEELYKLLVRCTLDVGQTSEARARAAAAFLIFPESVLLRFYSLLALPFVYASEEQITECRECFARGLETLLKELSPSRPEQRSASVAALANWSNFYLAYQGRNDRDLQVGYGELVTRIMEASYPDLVRRTAQPRPVSGRRIRVGYVSAFFRWHSVANTSVGWLLGHDRRQFEVFTYYTGGKLDARSAEFERASEHFRHIPFPRGFPDNPVSKLEQFIEQLTTDDLDILVYTDIGMWPPATMLAALRLAPVQCTSWGHPITSGLPNIDYFLSGDLMEPVDADRHYSERLIRLPNLGVSYPYPGTPQQLPRRAHFGLPEDAVVYLSCQSLYKYLPQDDHVFAEIAKAVPNSIVVFLQFGQPAVDAIFRERLERAFARLGLQSEQRCILLRQMDYLEYRGLMNVADVFLDTIHWAGANTTYDAVATGLPVVTMPGDFMRGRHCYAILRMLGLDELVAADKAEYVAIAARLGSDSAWRKEIREAVLSRRKRVFEDRSTVAALEEFYRSAIARHDAAVPRP
jgi:protein O-GlcNAc transferase